MSIRLQLSPDESKIARKQTEMPTSATACHHLDLFPPHPENLVEEKYTYTHDQDNVAYFFSIGDGGANTLTGLLDASAITSSSSNNKNSIGITSLSPSASLTYTYG
ncbi:uncharacterized protein Fot_02942 [Forsythia ovata]|uniref:Uncharacterized protein n=1 Tax=Forsythia ovata TaxID=205694 RepID=A0ABD1XBA3_9LAMI